MGNKKPGIDLEGIRQRIEDSKKTLKKTEIKAEELDATVHAAMEAYETAKQGRKSPTRR